MIRKLIKIIGVIIEASESNPMIILFLAVIFAGIRCAIIEAIQ